MKKTPSKIILILPILFGFFVMGFADVVGIATSYVKNDFNLSETVAGFLPSVVFLWFLLLSVPTAIMMNRLGRKRTVQLSNIITFVGMAIPFVSYNIISCMVAFALLGIGNTILQVALNPLLTNVVSGKTLTSSLTAGQVLKAVSAFLGPFIALFALNTFGKWQYIFPAYALITLLSMVWLMLTPVPKEAEPGRAASVGGTFALLKNPEILLLFLGIVFVVGIDVGTNTATPKLLIERCGMTVERAGLGSSVYFVCRTAGAFIGAFLLARLSDVKYFRINIVLALAALVGLAFVQGQTGILVLVGAVGFLCSCVFSIIFSAALRAVPEKANEISGLMITGVVGGAIVPPLMGFMTDLIGSQVGSLTVLGICAAYLIFCSFRLKEKAVPAK